MPIKMLMLDFTSSTPLRYIVNHIQVKKTLQKLSFYIVFRGFRLSINFFSNIIGYHLARVWSTIAESGTIRDVKVRVRERTHAFVRGDYGEHIARH